MLNSCADAGRSRQQRHDVHGEIIRTSSWLLMAHMHGGGVNSAASRSSDRIAGGSTCRSAEANAAHLQKRYNSAKPRRRSESVVRYQLACSERTEHNQMGVSQVRIRLCAHLLG